jgi:hypothetical protein
MSKSPRGISLLSPMLENFLKNGKTMLENFLGVLNDLTVKLEVAFVFLLFLRIKKGQGNEVRLPNHLRLILL